MLGAISLLANTLLPGLAYATTGVTPVKIADGIIAITSEENYNFVSYSEDGETEYGTGNVIVLNKGTVVNVTENYKVDSD
jgi:hypothetical protein